MTICDVSAIDRLIDFYGEYLLVQYDNDTYELSDLRDFLEDSKVKMSVDDCIVDRTGISRNGSLIVSLVDLEKFGKDDLIKI